MLVKYFFIFLLFIVLIMRCDGKKMDISIFGAFDEDLLVEVELIIAIILVKSS